MRQGYDNVLSLNTTAAFVPAGITNAILISPEAAQNCIYVKYGTGGSCYLFGVTSGATIAAANFASLLTAGQYYPLGASESLNLQGPTRFYLGATAATVTIYCAKGKNE